MIRTDSWQSETILTLQNLLVRRGDVIVLALFGSALQANTSSDPWSDVDVLLIVEDRAYPRFYPSVAWLGDFGAIFAVEQFENPFHSTTRICFTDFRRLDLLIVKESKLRDVQTWPSIPFWRGASVLFSHSSEVTQLLNQAWTSPTFTPPTPADFDQMTNHFWFKAMLASYKVIRNDRLIALHLAMDLVRDCCVLGMMLRDRATGTNIHRQGGIGNDLVDEMQIDPHSYSSAGILYVIEQSAIQFDRLAQQWTDNYQAKRAPLLEWITHMRHTLKIPSTRDVSEAG